MSKYGPAWVWFATGQSLGQVTPSSTLHRRGCQPQSTSSIHATLAVLPNSAIGNWDRGGIWAEPGQRKGGYGELWGPPKLRICPQMQQSSLTHERWGQRSAWTTKHTGVYATKREKRGNLPKDSGQGGGQWLAREQNSKGGGSQPVLPDSQGTLSTDRRPCLPICALTSSPAPARLSGFCVPSCL